MSEQKRYAGTESDAKQRDENNATFQNQPEKIRFESSPTEKIDNNYITVKCFTQLKTGGGGGNPRYALVHGASSAGVNSRKHEHLTILLVQ